MGCRKISYYKEQGALRVFSKKFGEVLKESTCVLENSSDYYPFGMLQLGRHGNSASYRYGFNGMEKDDEVKGDGNSLDFGARIYDSRVGRWLSVDKMDSKHPGVTPYNFVRNNPILRIDPDGNTDFTYTVKYRENKDGTLTKVVKATAVYYVVNLTSNSYVDKSSINTGNLNKAFDVSFTPGSTGNKNPIKDDKQVSKIEFDIDFEFVDLSPEEYSKLPENNNVFFLVDKVSNTGEGGELLAWATIGGQATIFERGSALNNLVVYHELGHNFGLQFPHNKGDEGHSNNVSSWMYATSSGGKKQPTQEIITVLINMGILASLPEGQVFPSSENNNNAQDNGKDLLKSKTLKKSKNIKT